jgi:hypothetical protein
MPEFCYAVSLLYITLPGRETTVRQLTNPDELVIKTTLARGQVQPNSRRINHLSSVHVTSYKTVG